jgi:nucleoside-diphosphate-sugar epimerase
MSKRVFMTGGTGFIGGHLAHQLLDAGYDVAILARTPEKAADLARRGAEIVKGDILAPETFRDAMKGSDVVFHAAAWYKLGARDATPADRINVDGTGFVLRKAAALGVPRIIYTSSTVVFGNPDGRPIDETYRYMGTDHLSAYARSKWMAHYGVARPLIDEGAPIIIVMPGGVYGPGDHSSIGQAFRLMLDRRLLVFPDSEARVPLAHVEDIARGHLLALERGEPGEEYILAESCPRWNDVIALFEAITGIPGPLLRPGPRLTRAIVGLVGAAEHMIPVPPLFSTENLRFVSEFSMMVKADKARDALGWDPRPLAEGLRQTLEAEIQDKNTRGLA